MVDRIRREVIERTYLCRAGHRHGNAPTHPSPEQILLTLEALGQIADPLAGVSAKAREAFLLHYLEERSHAEIAAKW